MKTVVWKKEEGLGRLIRDLFPLHKDRRTVEENEGLGWLIETLLPSVQTVVLKEDECLSQFWTYSETLLLSMQTLVLKENDGLAQYWT